MLRSLVGSEMCIRDRYQRRVRGFQRAKMALIVPQSEFQHILRVLNTNIEGRHKVPFAITAIRGIGRRFANIICKKAEIDPNKRAGELGPDEIEKIVTVISRPLQFIPPWMVNRTKDIKDGKTTHVVANGLDSKLRDSLERLWKIKAHRGLRHGWGLRVRGQKTCTTGRKGRTVGVARKKGQ
eukprot:TRINITY_DN3_c0_g1_i2.p1 TRINITY_DN3_c0_g1~~TRINITY_DN3_c0_g1_i2.p1  ORF type:complete len:182 (+),score=56.29 TRINITY_DN3_c0_g1_i2:109-654(+)